MKSLQDLTLFVRTAETGSLSAAARGLDITPAVASAALKRLEAELDTLLFVRSTRHLRLTAEGEGFLEYCKQALALLADGQEALNTGRAVVRGVLQISAPSDFGRNVLAGWLDEFQMQFPDIQLRLHLSDRLADLYRQPVDISLRYGTPSDSTLVALPLAPDNPRVLCAAPGYLAKAGMPRHIEDLAQHNCLCYVLGEYVHDRWRFFHRGQEVSVKVHGDRISDDGDMVRRWALAGYGVAYKSCLDVADDLKAGRLLRLCEAWQGEPSPLHLVCTDRRQISPAVQQLRAFLLPRCAALLSGYESAF